ncbi:hypothetical protein HPB50_025653 [Hyalomma asiaticum]|uniref:Uncharacterized protein n=1 Tax=Hyalomma asiaticum TaxID=266040 RepID=A0ACB7TNM2_HYAAI|nr:hypothetical protein HPB50_025653 [Hyalomma asiaticum]
MRILVSRPPPHPLFVVLTCFQLARHLVSLLICALAGACLAGLIGYGGGGGGGGGYGGGGYGGGHSYGKSLPGPSFLIKTLHHVSKVSHGGPILSNYDLGVSYGHGGGGGGYGGGYGHGWH